MSSELTTINPSKESVWPVSKPDVWILRVLLSTAVDMSSQCEWLSCALFFCSTSQSTLPSVFRKRLSLCSIRHSASSLCCWSIGMIWRKAFNSSWTLSKSWLLNFLSSTCSAIKPSTSSWISSSNFLSSDLTFSKLAVLDVFSSAVWSAVRSNWTVTGEPEEFEDTRVFCCEINSICFCKLARDFCVFIWNPSPVVIGKKFPPFFSTFSESSKDSVDRLISCLLSTISLDTALWFSFSFFALHVFVFSVLSVSSFGASLFFFELPLLFGKLLPDTFFSSIFSSEKLSSSLYTTFSSSPCSSSGA